MPFVFQPSLSCFVSLLISFWLPTLSSDKIYLLCGLLQISRKNIQKKKKSMGCENTLRCVHCGFPLKSLYIQYSPGNIRLMKCVSCHRFQLTFYKDAPISLSLRRPWNYIRQEKCKKVADEYIECENMVCCIIMANSYMLHLDCSFVLGRLV